MATIKDVAKLAGVSLGTVSNVIHGKTNNEDIIAKVEDAINQLQYTPDVMAQGLKSAKFNVIGVVVPDVTEPEYNEFLMALERSFQAKGYSIIVKFSRGNGLLERQAVNMLIDMHLAAIILYSVTVDDFCDEWAHTDTYMLMLTQDKQVKFHGDTFVLDYTDAFGKLIHKLNRDRKKVGLISNQIIYKKGRLNEIYSELYSDKSEVLLSEDSEETGIHAGFEICYKNSDIDTLIVSGHTTSVGVKKALDLLNKQIDIYAIKSSRWAEDVNNFVGEISIPIHQMAKKVVERVIEVIRHPNGYERLVQEIHADLKLNLLIESVVPSAKNNLRFAMYDCSSARSLQIYSMLYQQQTGIQIKFDMYDYEDLEKRLYDGSERKENYYDGFMMDITWFEGLVESGGVLNLDHLLQDKKDYLKDFANNAIKDLGMYIESLYAIPFMSGAQILFYRRDLFENPVLRRKYYRKYKEKLNPPKTWQEFNTIGEFFTRAFNPDSPTTYGISIPYGNNVYIAIDFLNRLWSFGGKLFDEIGNIRVNSISAESAMDNLLKSYQFCSQAEISSWDEVAEEFQQGNSAMTILYNSDMGNIDDPARSKVAGNLGYAAIPGGTSVKGGWSLALNRYGKHVDDAENFLLWACDKKNGVPLTVLGGSTLRTEYFTSQDLEKVQPWKDLVLEANQKSRKRDLPEILDESKYKNNIYTKIIPDEITAVINHEIDVKTALSNMEKRIYDLIHT